MRLIGRSLQILAMLLLPLAIVLQLGGQLARSIGVSDMLVMLVFGIGLFYVGRLMEGLAQR
ncbi:MAG: hypothetical protein J5I93_12620 [Pirellulaceae bacterium]|nr:hypothetical protein [Pirellulaceae bacterium]